MATLAITVRTRLHAPGTRLLVPRPQAERTKSDPSHREILGLIFS